MRIALGLKAHSGWAALVAITEDGGELRVVDRRRIELVDPDDAGWAKAPYHAAENLKPAEARKMVERAIGSARRVAVRELRSTAKRARDASHDVAACAVLVGEPMPAWSTDEILAVHFRMHKAEGVLFREALARAARACGWKLHEIREKQLVSEGERALGTPAAGLAEKMKTIGKAAGPPWGKDQKDAALAACIALRDRST